MNKTTLSRRARRSLLALATATAGVAFGSAAVAFSGTAQAPPAPNVAPRATTPAPHVAPFAQDPGRPPKPALTSASPVPFPEGADGCDHAYGQRGQCVPWQFPSHTGDACAWLRSHGFGPLAVHGRDRHELDRDGDGVACGPRD